MSTVNNFQGFLFGLFVFCFYPLHQKYLIILLFHTVNTLKTNSENKAASGETGGGGGIRKGKLEGLVEQISLENRILEHSGEKGNNAFFILWGDAEDTY